MFRSAVMKVACLCSLALLPAASGCSALAPFYQPPPEPEMLGAKVDPLLQTAEENAEASKFVIYQHEFELDRHAAGSPAAGFRLNEYGEDHVRRIAENLRNGAPYAIVVERSQTSIRAGTKYAYPVHGNPELDQKRREVTVRALARLGVADADSRVVVAPAFAQPLTGNEAEAAYARGMSGWEGGAWGMGAGGGGMGAGFGGGWF